MTEWQRVNRNHPCEICNHTDWCTFTVNGSCCMRVESIHPMHNGGWWHTSARPGSNRQPVPYKGTALPLSYAPIDFDKLITRWRKEKAGELESYAATLGVGKQDLDDLHVAYAPEYRAFAFPMYRPDGTIAGIRLRNEFHKWSVKGGHQGLFIPFAAVKRFPIDPVMIVEGPTDAAAGLALGFFTIGRPNNLVGNEMIVEVLNSIPVKSIIVCYDNDEHLDSMGKLIRPGPVGAERLIKYLKYRVTRFVPPTKDLRSFLTSGGTRDLLLSTLTNTVHTHDHQRN
jgi:hypothetical protein